MESKAGTGVTLRIERTIAAPPEAVFAAWTRAEAVSTWFAPSDEYTAVIHELDVRVGGRLRIEMRHAGGKSHTVAGVFRDVQVPRRLAFTWAWVGQPEAEDTLVTVKIEPHEAGTRLLLVHEGFANQAQCDEHDKGWTGCLARFPGVVHGS
jgi:uncharacterized protein YndB with AHSA1/START domain